MTTNKKPTIAWDTKGGDPSDIKFGVFWRPTSPGKHESWLWDAEKDKVEYLGERENNDGEDGTDYPEGQQEQTNGWRLFKSARLKLEGDS